MRNKNKILNTSLHPIFVGVFITEKSYLSFFCVHETQKKIIYKTSFECHEVKALYNYCETCKKYNQ